VEVLRRVVGPMWASVKHPAVSPAARCFVVQPLDETGKDTGAELPFAIDHVQAGVGDKVLVLTEGNGVRQILQMGDVVPIRSMIVGIVDPTSTCRRESSFRPADRRGLAPCCTSAGWVANHDGNVTARANGQRFIATADRDVEAPDRRARDLIEVDAKGRRRRSRPRVRRDRASTSSVLRAAAPMSAPSSTRTRRNATADRVVTRQTRSSSRSSPEAVVSLGPRIPKPPPTHSLATRGRPALAPWCDLVDAVLLGNHGVITWGKDPETALLRLEPRRAPSQRSRSPRKKSLGGVDPLSRRNANRSLSFASRCEGRHRRARGSRRRDRRAAREHTPAAVVACAPAPHAKRGPRCHRRVSPTIFETWCAKRSSQRCVRSEGWA